MAGIDAEERFDEFVRVEGARIQRALVVAYGPTAGADATQSALGYGWEHWSRVSAMQNPAGYLYRVGQSAARRERRRPFAAALNERGDDLPDYEPGLVTALAALTEQQRIAVVLIHGHGQRLAEVADLLGISVSTLRNHLRRGLTKLRNELGVEHVGT